MKYWFYSYVEQAHPLHSGRVAYGNGVDTRHPFEVETEARAGDRPSFVLLCWAEISKEEWDGYNPNGKQPWPHGTPTTS